MLVERAIQVIKDHGHTAIDTKDGLLAISWEGGEDWQLAPKDDWYCEAPCVFEVHFEPSMTDGFAVAHVDGKAIRHWLGY